MVFFVFSGILGPSGRFSPTRQIPPADRWERWGESGGLVKSTTGPKMSENVPKFPCRLYSHAGGLHNPEGQVSAVASPYWYGGRMPLKFRLKTELAARQRGSNPSDPTADRLREVGVGSGGLGPH